MVLRILTPTVLVLKVLGTGTVVDTGTGPVMVDVFLEVVAEEAGRSTVHCSHCH